MNEGKQGVEKDREALAAEELRVVERGGIEEMADFYDRADTGDLPWDETDDTVIERLELEQISIRLPREDLVAIRQRAARAGVGYTTLIRMILREHLHKTLTR